MTNQIKITRTADGKELRSFGGSFEIRAAEDEYAISGMAVAYNVRSGLIGGQFYELVAPGAFDDTLRSDDQVCCFNHDANQLLGRKSSGTLKLVSSLVGLQFRCTLDRSNPVHQSVYASVKRGDLNGCSFQFTVQPDGDQWQPQGDTVLRTVRKAKLYELGPVVFPAYPSTSVGARAEARSLDYVLDFGRPAATPDNWRARTEARLKALEAHLATSTEAVRFGVP